MDNQALINGEFVTLNDEQVKKAKQFHLNRIPFAWVKGELKINTSETDDRDHQHWLCEDFGLTILKFERTPRGYFIKGRFQLFMGSDFGPIPYWKSDEISKESFYKLLEMYFDRYPDECDCYIYNGVHVGKVGEIWPPMSVVAQYGIMRKIVKMEMLIDKRL